MAVLLAGCAGREPVPTYQTPPETTPDGLVRSDNAVFDLVYVRPGTSLERYTRLQVRPIQVAYAEKNPDFALTEAQRRRVADSFSRAFSRAMTSDGRFTLTDAKGPGVLRMNVALAQLSVRIAEAEDHADHFHLDRAGEITLVAEAVDSITGQTLVRGRDTRAFEGDASTVDSEPHIALEVGDVFRNWARELRSGIDQLSEEQ